MQSELLLGITAVLIVAPGLAAALLAYPPGEIGILTRCAAVFGIGFAVAGGCAFVLAVTHVFWLKTYIPLWLVSTIALWLFALRRGQLREHLRAAAGELADNRLPLLLGAGVFLALLVVESFNLHSLPGPHYVYYLNGMEIANSHGVPSRVLEDAHGWPPATDKVFLDAFTGVLPLLHSSALVGPGVLLMVAFTGAAIGLWAFAWELGLRRLGILLPVLMLANTQLAGRTMAGGFVDYRAEDFGIAVAFCGAALGIAAIRSGGYRAALVAGVVLAAATGTHLIPAMIAVVILASVVVGELVRRGHARARREVVRVGVALAASSGVLALAIRLLAGGSFGVGGAVNQASYSLVHTKFDPTAFMFSGANLPRDPTETNHFYVAPGSVLRSVMHAATNLNPGTVAALLILVLALVAVVASVIYRHELSPAVFAGAGILFGITAIALYFSYSYHVWIEATFGVRRPTAYAPIGLILVVLALLEAILLAAARRRWRFSSRAPLAAGVAIVLLVSGWLVPGATPSHFDQQLNVGQRVFATWVRTHTPCGARFLLDQRSEGAVAALTGRMAVDEGMGSFLRPKMLPYVIRVLLAARSFFSNPVQYQSVLQWYHVNYVVVASESLLGYPGPIKPGKIWGGRSTPFLRPVARTRWFRIYRVKGSEVVGTARLLKGPYLHCQTTPAHF